MLEQAYSLDLSFLFQLRSARTTRGHFDGLHLAAERDDQQRGGCERGQRQRYRRGNPASSRLPTRLTLAASYIRTIQVSGLVDLDAGSATRRVEERTTVVAARDRYQRTTFIPTSLGPYIP